MVLLGSAALAAGACDSRPGGEAAKETPTLARTEFTDRIENFFEYEPLRAGRPSQFLIHVTDLSDGSPVERAEVTLTVRPPGGGTVIAQTRARVGKVTGIYVASLAVPSAGRYDIEFHVRNPKVDEHMSLRDFQVE